MRLLLFDSFGTGSREVGKSASLVTTRRNFSERAARGQLTYAAARQ